MRIEELSVGNYVYYNKQRIPMSVYSLSNPMPDKSEFFNNKETVTLWCDGLIPATMEQIDGIPITHTLLLDNGFKQTVTDGMTSFTIEVLCHNTVSITLIETINGVYDIVYCGYNSHVPIMHVHQLQNIFSLITGRDLEIKISESF